MNENKRHFFPTKIFCCATCFWELLTVIVSLWRGGLCSLIKSALHSRAARWNLNFQLSGQKIEPKHHTKYLGVILDEHLSFNEHMNTPKPKCNRANGILAKLRYYVSANTLKIIYYLCTLWLTYDICTSNLGLESQ